MTPSKNVRPMTLSAPLLPPRRDLSIEDQSYRILRKRLLRYILSNHVRREAERGLAPLRSIQV